MFAIVHFGARTHIQYMHRRKKLQLILQNSHWLVKFVNTTFQFNWPTKIATGLVLLLCKSINCKKKNIYIYAGYPALNWICSENVFWLQEESCSWIGTILQMWLCSLSRCPYITGQTRPGNAAWTYMALHLLRSFSVNSTYFEDRPLILTFSTGWGPAFEVK